MLSGIILGDVNDRDAQLWAGAVRATAVVSPQQLKKVTRLIRALKAGGVWSSLDRLWLFASENSTQALTDLVARASATAQNSPTFTANRGYAGNGSSSYVDTGFNASSAGGLYTQNNSHLSAWVETAESVAARICYIGNDFGVGWSMIGRLNGTTLEGGLQNNNTIAGTFTTQTGLWCVRRSGATASAVFQNGASFNTSASTSYAVQNANTVVLANNTLGTKSNYTNGRVSSASIGASLSDAQQSAFYNAMRTYMTAVGVA